MRITRAITIVTLVLSCTSLATAESGIVEVKAGEAVPGYEARVSGLLQACKSMRVLGELSADLDSFYPINSENMAAVNAMLESYTLMNRDDGCLIRTQVDMTVNVIDHSQGKVLVHISTYPEDGTKIYDTFYMWPFAYTKIE